MDHYYRSRFVLDFGMDKERLHFAIAVLDFDEFLMSWRFFEPGFGPILSIGPSFEQHQHGCENDASIHESSLCDSWMKIAPASDCYSDVPIVGRIQADAIRESDWKWRSSILPGSPRIFAAPGTSPEDERR